MPLTALIFSFLSDILFFPSGRWCFHRRPFEPSSPRRRGPKFACVSRPHPTWIPAFAGTAFLRTWPFKWFRAASHNSSAHSPARSCGTHPRSARPAV
ncbi:MAG: hypothetical protein EOO79_04255 [Oxalobacteraceae bacterium]|nr:MAG: hypothetical protein EOO79_04255 [Oxalobacteraceae bacterium]